MIRKYSKTVFNFRILLAAIVAALGLTACVPLGEPAVHQKPNNPKIHDNADPFVYTHENTHYLFGTGTYQRIPVRAIKNFDAHTSSSLVTIKPKEAMPTQPAWVNPKKPGLWAPSIIPINGRFYMYFSASHSWATTDMHNDKCIGRAVASHPSGPYVPEKNAIYCGLPPEDKGNGEFPSNRFGRGAVDPEVFRDKDGHLFMHVALGRTTDNIAAVRLHADGTVIGGLNAPATVLVGQVFPWHDGVFDNKLTLTFLENPSMVHEPHTDTYLLFYSAGWWHLSTYNTGFSRCQTPAGPCTHDSRGPFLSAGAKRSGPGGLSTFRDSTGQLRVVYATWQTGHENPVWNFDNNLSRQTHWAKLYVERTRDPAVQTVKLVN